MDCQLVGKCAVGLSAEGRLINETTPHPIEGTGKGKRVSRYLSTTQLIGSAVSTSPSHRGIVLFPLINPYDSYYHWVAEYLPKLRFLDHYERETGKQPKILIDANLPSFVKNTLEIAGYVPHRYKEWKQDVVGVDRLVIPIHRSHTFDYNEPAMSEHSPSRLDLMWLRDQILSNLNTTPTGYSEKRLYVSRQEVAASEGRGVLNYEEMKRILQKFGFESYAFENLSFREQVRLFNEADVIMGPHGAGLVNMIFSNGVTIIELLPENNIKPYFYFLCNIMGFEYEAIVTDSKGSNLVIDSETLDKRLESCL